MKNLVATILVTALAAAPVLADTVASTPGVVPVADKTLQVKGVKRRAPHRHRHSGKKHSKASKAATSSADTKPGN